MKVFITEVDLSIYAPLCPVSLRLTRCHGNGIRFDFARPLRRGSPQINRRRFLLLNGGKSPAVTRDGYISIFIQVVGDVLQVSRRIGLELDLSAKAHFWRAALQQNAA